MSVSPTTSSRTRLRRRLGRSGLFVGALLLGGACTPQWAIHNFFGDRAQEAERIVQCESEMNPHAVSPTNDHGLFQINAVHRGDFERVTGQPWSMVYDPYWNSHYAKWLYDQQGWGPWTCRKVL